MALEIVASVRSHFVLPLRREIASAIIAPEMLSPSSTISH
jgi:hypothetical protein